MSLRVSHTSAFFSTCIAVSLIALLHSTSADQTPSSRLLRAEARAVYSVWDVNDVCNHPDNSSSSGSPTCTTCLTRPDCAIESTTGKCVTASLIDTKLYIEYIKAGDANYCNASNDACTACGADTKNVDSDAVCRGADGCVCVHQCELATAVVPEPDSATSSYLFKALIAMGILAPIIVMTQLYKSLTSNVMSTTERELLRERELARRAANPLTMKLDGWRSYIEKEQKEQPENLELKLCPTRLSDDALSRSSTLVTDDASHDEESDQSSSWDVSRWKHSDSVHSEVDEECKESEHEYVAVASTPRGGQEPVEPKADLTK